MRAYFGALAVTIQSLGTHQIMPWINFPYIYIQAAFSPDSEEKRFNKIFLKNKRLPSCKNDKKYFSGGTICEGQFHTDMHKVTSQVVMAMITKHNNNSEPRIQ